jgi:hypothetical protein
MCQGVRFSPPKLAEYCVRLQLEFDVSIVGGRTLNVGIHIMISHFAQSEQATPDNWLLLGESCRKDTLIKPCAPMPSSDIWYL